MSTRQRRSPRDLARDLVDADEAPDLTEEEPIAPTDEALNDELFTEEDVLWDDDLLAEEDLQLDETELDPTDLADDEPGLVFEAEPLTTLDETEPAVEDLADDALTRLLATDALDELPEALATLTLVPWRTRATLNGELVDAELDPRAAGCRWLTQRAPAGTRSVLLRLDVHTVTVDVDVVNADEELLVIGRAALAGRIAVRAD